MSNRYEWINGETYCDSDQMYDNETGNKTQPVYVADLLNEQDQKIKSLERKVSDAEQEKERIRKNWQISKTHQQKLYNNLKQQNKAKGIVNYPITLDGCRIANEEQLLDFAKDFCLEKKYWQKQLAEKEKERHEEWLTGKEWKWECDRLRRELHTANQETLNFQNKYFAEKQIAIEELEKVLEWLNIPFDENGCLKNGEDLENYIDQQIKLLKGEK